MHSKWKIESSKKGQFWARRTLQFNDPKGAMEVNGILNFRTTSKKDTNCSFQKRKKATNTSFSSPNLFLQSHLLL